MRQQIISLALAAASASQAQTTAMDCVPPLVPSTEASPSLLRDFEDEIRAEFNDYFDEAQRYIHCLDAASQSANREVLEVLEAHRRLFPNG